MFFWMAHWNSESNKISQVLIYKIYYNPVKIGSWSFINSIAAEFIYEMVSYNYFLFFNCSRHLWHNKVGGELSLQEDERWIPMSLSLKVRSDVSSSVAGERNKIIVLTETCYSCCLSGCSSVVDNKYLICFFFLCVFLSSELVLATWKKRIKGNIYVLYVLLS